MQTQKLAQPKIKALVVDDEEPIRSLIAMALRHEGWEVQTAADGKSALAAVRAWEPDVIVLDIMLPKITGMAVLSQLRQENYLQPVLFLTALDSVDDRVKGLTAGGDDYVTKPFSLEELIARLRGLIRRSQMHGEPASTAVLRVGDLVLNEESYEVLRGGEPLDLTATEFELLRYLMRNANRVLSKAQILDRVWSYDYAGKASVVELYISYLRRKIDTPNRPKLLHTVRGAGYILKS